MNVRSSLGSVALTAVAGAVLAGCGHGGTTAAPTLSSSSTPPATTSSAVPVTTSASAAPTTSAVPVPTTTSASPTPTATAPPPGPCTTSQLTFTLGARTTGGGRTSAPLTLRNASSASCTLHGNPGVDVVDSYGMQAGPAAEALSAGSATTVTLAHGAAATATFSYVAATTGGTSCSPDTAATLLVFAPGSATSATVPFAVSLCTAASDRPGITPVVAGS